MTNRAAVHEAGHAIISLVLGRAVKRASIIEDDDTAGRVTHRPIGDWFQPDIEIDGRTRRRIKTEIMTFWAGTLAEERQGESTPEQLEVGFASDRASISDLAVYSTGSIYEAEAYIEWLRRRTEALLNRWGVWSAIEAVADALIEERELSGRRVREIYHATVGPLVAASAGEASESAPG